MKTMNNDEDLKIYNEYTINNKKLQQFIEQFNFIEIGHNSVITNGIRAEEKLLISYDFPFSDTCTQKSVNFGIMEVSVSHTFDIARGYESDNLTHYIRFEKGSQLSVICKDYFINDEFRELIENVKKWRRENNLQ